MVFYKCYAVLIKLSFWGAFKVLWVTCNCRLRYKMFICLIILGEFESFFILLKGRSLITFPKVVADLFSVLKATFSLIQKFLIS